MNLIGLFLCIFFKNILIIIYQICILLISFILGVYLKKIKSVIKKRLSNIRSFQQDRESLMEFND